MKKQPHPWKSVLACVGAVIGAGFVSGREIYSFFTRYGEASWGLILLSAATMVFLCTLCMRRAQQEQADCWCSLQCFSGTKMGALARGCVTALMLVTGGAMVSAAGHLTELLWPSSWAYTAGAVGTLLLAWLLGSRGVGPLSAVSGFLTALLIGVMLVLMRQPGAGESAVRVQDAPGSLLWGAIRAVGYGSMNMTVAIGVACQAEKGESGCRCCDRRALLTGLVLTGLLFGANALYLRYPGLQQEAFPIVRLFHHFRRAGYVLCVVLLYLAVLTTLTAVLYALRGDMEGRGIKSTLSAALTLGLPLAVSVVGFAGIVDGLYTPVGLCCLGLVFLPMLFSGRKPRRA